MTASLTVAERVILDAIEAKGYVLVPRNPTEEMLQAGEDETWEPSSDRPYIGRYTLGRVWGRMIDTFINGQSSK